MKGSKGCNPKQTAAPYEYVLKVDTSAVSTSSAGVIEGAACQRVGGDTAFGTVMVTLADALLHHERLLGPSYWSILPEEDELIFTVESLC